MHFHSFYQLGYIEYKITVIAISSNNKKKLYKIREPLPRWKILCEFEITFRFNTEKTDKLIKKLNSANKFHSLNMHFTYNG